MRGKDGEITADGKNEMCEVMDVQASQTEATQMLLDLDRLSQDNCGNEGTFF